MIYMEDHGSCQCFLAATYTVEPKGESFGLSFDASCFIFPLVFTDGNGYSDLYCGLERAQSFWDKESSAVNSCTFLAFTIICFGFVFILELENLRVKKL